jgi:hypothetical protein
MNHLPMKKSTVWLSVLVGMVLVSWPTTAEAAMIGFHNTLKKNIYIEAVSIIRGRAFRDKPLLIKPGQVSWHTNVPPGNRVIYVYGAGPPVRLMYQGTVAVGAQNLFYAVQPQQPVQGMPRAKLVPSQPPNIRAKK